MSSSFLLQQPLGLFQSLLLHLHPSLIGVLDSCCFLQLPPSLPAKAVRKSHPHSPGRCERSFCRRSLPAHGGPSPHKWAYHHLRPLPEEAGAHAEETCHRLPHTRGRPPLNPTLRGCSRLHMHLLRILLLCQLHCEQSRLVRFVLDSADRWKTEEKWARETHP